VTSALDSPGEVFRLAGGSLGAGAAKLDFGGGHRVIGRNYGART
jgi:hypothetical protein